MNLDSIQIANVSPKPVAAPRQGQQQIDITSAEPAVPAPQASGPARSAGASAKFTGSGGAIVGTYADEGMFKELKKALGKLKIRTIKPRVARAAGGR